MIERQRLELEDRAGAPATESRPRSRDRESLAVSPLSEVGNEHRPPHRRQRANDFGDTRRAVMPLAAVGVAVGGDEYLRLDLSESVDDALHAKVRRARRPDRADRRRAERGDDRFGQIRKIAGDAIAGPTPSRRSAGRKRTNRAMELAARHRTSGPIFALEDRAPASSPRRAAGSSAKLSVASGKNVAPGIRSRSLDDALAHRAAHVRRTPTSAARNPADERWRTS